MSEQVYQEPSFKYKQKKVFQPKILKMIYAPKIELYYWAPRLGRGQVGHLSLRIIDDEEDIYISNWPKGLMRTFLKDCDEEGRDPDEYVNIPSDKVYVNKVKEWWKQFINARNSGREGYNLVANNCAQVVYKALRAGSFPHYFILATPHLFPVTVKDWVKCYL